MSKTYFAKYLSVEGEIKEGDMVLDTLSGEIICWWDGDNWDKNDKKVKLFLCSRDIQVGDKINWPSGAVSITEEEMDVRDSKAFGCFKVIGEISPDASWVKEGDEFERLDWEYQDALEDNKNPDYKIIQFKCPCCGGWR